MGLDKGDPLNNFGLDSDDHQANSVLEIETLLKENPNLKEAIIGTLELEVGDHTLHTLKRGH